MPKYNIDLNVCADLKTTLKAREEVILTYPGAIRGIVNANSYTIYSDNTKTNRISDFFNYSSNAWLDAANKLGEINMSSNLSTAELEATPGFASQVLTIYPNAYCIRDPDTNRYFIISAPNGIRLSPTYNTEYDAWEMAANNIKKGIMPK